MKMELELLQQAPAVDELPTLTVIIDTTHYDEPSIVADQPSDAIDTITRCSMWLTHGNLKVNPVSYT